MMLSHNFLLILNKNKQYIFLFLLGEMYHISFYSLLFVLIILVTAEIYIKMSKVLSFWYSKIVFRHSNDDEKTIYRNLERCTLKLEKKKSHFMFNESHYNNVILLTYTNIITKEKCM